MSGDAKSAVDALGLASREQARNIVAATDLPVSADLEKGFGDTPEIVAETVRLAASIGLAGCSIEDATGKKDRPLFDFNQAVERVAAAVQAARSLPIPFTLTARSENFLRGNPDLDDTIKRLQAFEKAGAARLIEQSQLTGARLQKEVAELVKSPGTLEQMGEAARAFARPGAAQRAADVLESFG